MRKALIAAVVLLLATGAGYLGYAAGQRPQETPTQGVRVGQPALDFALKNMQDEVVTLAQMQGKVVLLNLWATWCPPCLAEMPSMEKLNRVMAGEDFVMLAVNVEADGRETVGEFLKKQPHSFTVLLDTDAEVQARYGVYRFPESFIIDRNGIIVKHVIGARDWAAPDMVSYLQSLVKE
ncbi:thioredoxin [Desulfuromonas versatilis]|uniref:Thioredoxin n=1 Tax=Desulfuromonas versatilis TaxID=2802975 RepID=A0ABN6E2Y5_9BACT|nr:TlpA disulfide reductase family protein [Desulfuromonas versatilis]BCR05516.1 thioredoxin [Desulfuromonas versatilis]